MKAWPNRQRLVMAPDIPREMGCEQNFIYEFIAQIVLKPLLNSTSKTRKLGYYSGPGSITSIGGGGTYTTTTTILAFYLARIK